MSHTIPIIDTRGDGRERGRQHGEAAREQIRRSLEYYRTVVMKTARSPWSELLDRTPRWNAAIEAYLPGILEEVRGIGEGAGIRFEEALALNARTGVRRLDEDARSCSSYALTPEATGDGHVYCGQNWDQSDAIADTIVMLRIEQPPKPAVITQTEAGQVGRQGANSAGLALNANGLTGNIPSREPEVPWAYRLRRILDASTMGEALDAVFTGSQSGCANILLTHRDGVAIDLETTPARHGWMYPTAGRLVHTNHFVAFMPPQFAETYRPSSPDSLYRLQRLEQGLRRSDEARAPGAARELIAAALRDHFGHPSSVCSHVDERVATPQRTETVLSSIVDLTAGEYWFTAGPPCESAYRKLPWNLYAGAREPVAAMGSA